MDGRTRERDPVILGVHCRAARGLVAELGRLRRADPRTGRVGKERAHDFPRIGVRAHHGPCQPAAVHPARRAPAPPIIHW